jgi:hypothetical protein
MSSSLTLTLSTPFRPLTYSDSKPNSLADLDQFLLREIGSGRNIDLIIQCVAQQFGMPMTMEDILLSYRSAYWRAKSWENRDTQVMEEIVFAEIRIFWERIASTVSETGFWRYFIVY